MRTIAGIMLVALATGAINTPSIAAPVAAADAATIQGLVQRTWARFGKTGAPRGPRFDPLRTPAFARAVAVYQKHVPGEEDAPDNIYCQCFDEYRPHLARVALDSIAANVIEARTSVLAGGLTNTVIWRFVHTPQGWLLDDLWEQGGPISVQRRPIKNGRRQ